MKNKTSYRPTKFTLARSVFTATLTVCGVPCTLAVAQAHKPLPALDPAPNPHRTRLILKDGSYQVIMSYRVVGHVVRYVSAERGGAAEEIPASLVDFDATRRWEKQHAALPAEGDAGT